MYIYIYIYIHMPKVGCCLFCVHLLMSCYFVSTSC